MEDKGLIDGILHYQQCLDKYAHRNDEARVLYCLSKLYKMPINIKHLEKTGVGRTVNSLRKLNGEIAEAAKTLVNKWKEMVTAVSEDSQANSVPKLEPIKKLENEFKEKHGSSHRNRSHTEADVVSQSRKVKDESRHSKTSYSDDGLAVNTEKVKHNSKRRDDGCDEDVSSKKTKHVHDSKKEYSKHKTKRKLSDSEESSDESSTWKDKSKSSKNRTEDYMSPHKELDSKHQDDSDESDTYTMKTQKVTDSSSKRRDKVKQSTKHGKSEDRSSSKHRRSSSKRHSSESGEECAVNLKNKSHSSKEEESSSSKHKKRNHDRKDEASTKSKHKSHKKEEKQSSKSKSNHKRSSDSEEESQHKNGYDYDEFIENINVDKKRKKKEEKNGESKSKSSDKKDKSRHTSHKSEKKSSTKGNIKIDENGIGSGSGASFAEALGMLIPPSKANKKKVSLPMEKQSFSRDSSPELTTSKVPDLLAAKNLAPLDVNVDNLLPEITPHYKPMGIPLNANPKKISNDDETLGAIMYSKISRTKVYSGNKVTWGSVPSLFDICTRVLQDNIDALEYTGGVPYLILKPVMERANPDQLFMLEHHNPYLIEDTDELWQLHCNKEFRSKKRQEMETWRDMYMRCLDEREAKLKALTANIKQSQDKSLPVRQTKLAYVDSVVKPPRNIARKQAKLGTGGGDKRPTITPSSRLTQLATAGAAGQVAVPNPGSRASSGSSSSPATMKPKKAPLMQKTLAFMKTRPFRR